MLRWWVALGILLCGGAVWSAGEGSDCARLLPKASELKGWQEIAGSFQYGKGEGLTALYNGGYNLYTDNGVLEAAQKLYRKGNDILTVTVHTMKSPSSARAFVAYWKKSNAKEKIGKTSAPGDGFIVAANGATGLYWANKRFFITIMVPKEGKEARSHALRALKAVAGKVKKGK